MTAAMDCCPYTFGTFVEGGPASDPTLNYTSAAATTVDLGASTIRSAGRQHSQFYGRGHGQREYERLGRHG